MHERLKKANGDASNQVMLEEDQRYGLYSTTTAPPARDPRARPRHHDRAKPADLQEGCATRTGSPTFVAER